MPSNRPERAMGLVLRLLLAVSLLMLAACDSGVTVDEDEALQLALDGYLGPAYLYLINHVPDEVQGYAINRASGALTAVPGAHKAIAPEGNNLVVDPTGTHLYGGQNDNISLFGFAVDAATGNLSALSGSPYSAIDNHIDIAMHPSGKFVYVAAFAPNNVELHSRDQGTGELTFINTYSVSGASPQALIVSPDGATLYVALRSSYLIERFSINQSTGALTTQQTIGTSAEPIAIVIDSTGSFMYVGHGLAPDVRAYAIAGNGSLSPLSPANYGMNDETHALAIDASGKFLYVAVPGQDQVQAFLRNPATGALSPIGDYLAGNFAESLATCGSFLYAGADDGADVTVYGINSGTGALTTQDTVATTSRVRGMLAYNCK